MGWRGFFVVLAFCAAACSDASVPAAPGGGAGGTIVIPLPTGGSGGSGAGTGAGGTGASNGTGGRSGSGGSGGNAASGGNAGSGGVGGAAASGACENGQDQAVFATLDPAVIREESARCSLSECQGDPDFNQCIAGCVQSTYLLSDACALCYGVLESCSPDACANQCAEDACSCRFTPECNPEQPPDYAQCEASFLDCTGTIPQDCRPS